jgi:hypothetical protein
MERATRQHISPMTFFFLVFLLGLFEFRGQYI